MKGDDQVIELLNEILTAELTAVNQYFLDAEMFRNWGYPRLAKVFRDNSIDEMKDAEELIARVLFLEGVPNVQRLGSVRIGETPVEKLRLALELEVDAVRRLREGIALCTGVNDHGSRELLERMLAGEEEHVDWFETQLSALDEVGEANYLAQQLHE